MIAIPGIVLTTTILIQAAAGSAAYLTWAVCAVLAFGIYNTASIGEADWIAGDGLARSRSRLRAGVLGPAAGVRAW